MSRISLSSADPRTLSMDALIIAVTPSEDDGVSVVGKAAEHLAEAFVSPLHEVLKKLGATGKAGEVTTFASLGATDAPVIIVAGIGTPGEGAEKREALRQASGAAIRTLKGCDTAAIAFPITDPQDAGAITEGSLIGAYTFHQYKTTEAPTTLSALTLVGDNLTEDAFKRAVTRGEAVAAAVNSARDWIHTPPHDLTPQSFAEIATQLATDHDLGVEVLDESALREGGYGGLTGVGQGSNNPPRLIRLTYRPAEATHHLALVGKGITFDSGGLSLKPPTGMMTMKYDMSGAAAVVAAMSAIADLKLNVNVTAYAAMAENMPSATAQRPSDVITIYGGTTVEVLNTDAEGRLVLADALVRAGEDKPDAIVDVATLTGAAAIALGTQHFAIMGNDDTFVNTARSAAATAGEQAWPLPLPAEMREKLKSSIADISNMGDRKGGTIQAGLFLQDFVPNDTPWVHFDIANTAFNEDKPFGYLTKGATGSAVRTLIRLAETFTD